ncbi:hypothetical protein [Pseudomonas chlororaphis]|uniref:hypothetical protein n=1 Tax=Pseudomonas chlororaphis TaxID=587753 RepID=UPI001F151711|nr:hypothetical protein [Pseudomonas chlororaphis]
MPGFIRVAPTLCVGILFFAFFDTVILSLFPTCTAAHGLPLTLSAAAAVVVLFALAPLRQGLPERVAE